MSLVRIAVWQRPLAEPDSTQPGVLATKLTFATSAILMAAIGRPRPGNRWRSSTHKRHTHSRSRRCEANCGTSAAGRCMYSSGEITRCVVSSREGIFSVNTPRPAALHCARSLASARRAMQRHSHSSNLRTSAPPRTAACRPKPCIAAHMVELHHGQGNNAAGGSSTCCRSTGWCRARPPLGRDPQVLASGAVAHETKLSRSHRNETDARCVVIRTDPLPQVERQYHEVIASR
jgi:hypothetical protein